jgi:hypothetical protein
MSCDAEGYHFHIAQWKLPQLTLLPAQRLKGMPPTFFNFQEQIEPARNATMAP